jgi:hypothetical protein
LFSCSFPSPLALLWVWLHAFLRTCMWNLTDSSLLPWRGKQHFRLGYCHPSTRLTLCHTTQRTTNWLIKCCIWGSHTVRWVLLSGMWRHVVQQSPLYVSEECTASTFKVQE